MARGQLDVRVLGRAARVGDAWTVIRGICTLQDGIRQPFFWSFVSLAILAVFTAGAVIRAKRAGAARVEGYYPVLDLDRVGGLAVFFIVLGLIVTLAFTGENPFVYFQF